MKTTVSQLKKIIAEEVKKVQLHKTRLSVPRGVTTLHEFLDVICDDWKAQFDPNDPSMEDAGGKDAWEEQCDEACNDLGEKIEGIFMQVQEALHNGEYYRDAPWGGKYRE